MKSFLLFFILIFCLPSPILAFENFKFHTLSQKGGLSYDGIIDILQDKSGFMWILLGENLFRFDGYTYKSYKTLLFENPESLPGYFNNLASDLEGNLYVSTSRGVYRNDTHTDSFTKIFNSPVNHIYIDKNNRLWINTSEGFTFLSKDNKPGIPWIYSKNQSLNRRMICENGDDLYFFSHRGVIYRYRQTDKSFTEWANFEKEFENSFLIDAIIKNGDLWVLTAGFNLYKIDLQTQQITYKYNHSNNNNTSLKCLYISDDENIWIGTMGGLYILDPKTNEIKLYQNNKNEQFSLPHNSVWTIKEDNLKNVWIGTYMGSIAYVNKSEEKVFDTFFLSPNGLNNTPVSSFSEIGNDIWVSTEGGGINILNKNNRRFTYLQQQQSINSISSNNTKKSVADKDGNVWIATYHGGLNRFHIARNQFTHIRKQKDDNQSLYSDNLRKIILEPDSGLWIIYLEHTTTISYYSFEKNRITHFSIDKDIKKRMDYDYIYDGYRDNDGRLWLITSNSLFSLDVKTKNIHLFPIPQKYNSASTLCADNSGLIWIGTFGNELIRFDPQDKSFVTYPDLLQSEIAEIYSINHSLENNGDQIIWMGTNDGLYMYNTISGFCAVFKESDGTQGNVYYPLSTMKDANGFLYFGGTGGFTVVDPSKVSFNPVRPNAVISDFYIDNKSTLDNNYPDGTVKYSKDLSTIKLNHRQLNFGFKFSSDNYLNPDKNLFRYRLKNYDNRWIVTDASNRTIFYSKIPSGKYEFQLQTANNDGLWGDISSLNIIREQSPWLTIPAIMIYLLAFCTLILYFIKSYKTRKKLELKLYLDQLEKEKNEEIYKNQLQFFTNISHDLKTPLSLIMVTINKMREEGMREYYYKILNNNANRLLGLLNDILDFRKIQHNKVNLSVSKSNISDFIQTIAGDFFEYAKQKDINYQIITDEEHLCNIPFDRNVMEKIIMNLLINSFKYTRKGDTINIIAGVKPFNSKYRNSYTVGDENLVNNATFSIVVSDTGVGISKESISKVFDRFYRIEAKNQRNHLGTGIGLALVKNLVLLHKGRITIFSERNQGSDFIIEFSTSINHYLPEEIQSQEDTLSDNNGELITDDIYPETNYKMILSDDFQQVENSAQKIIILAEDNIDLRTIAADSLSEIYKVIQFGDGKPALEYLMENDADLIISDIMMPEMDGITFCKMVKENIETSHIPFIMLTAKSGLESMLEGTESGANVYYEKPIDLTLIKTTIANIFKQQDTLREYYAKNYFADVTNESSNKQDNQFLKDITEIIEAHLDQSDLDVNSIAAKMKMSRSKLYSKIKTLTGKSVVEFILSYRLRRAAKYLIESKMNIQQAMFAVGIESQSYFTKAFKKEFNMPPSQFLLKHKENSQTDTH